MALAFLAPLPTTIALPNQPLMAYTKKLLPLTQTGKYPTLLTDYLDGRLAALDVYAHSPDIEGLAQAMAARMQQPPAISRDNLVQVLRQKYSHLTLTEQQEQNLNLLASPNTFTVTTGHQINLFTGPLYVPLKLLSTILLCKKLGERYPTHQFVPVYWMATEDHDRDEVDHFHLFGRKYQWPADDKGAVGRMPWPPSEAFIESLPKDLPQPLLESYLSAPTWADATRALVQHLLGHTGLLCLDPDHATLKEAFVPIALADALQHAHEPLHTTASQKLEAAGYKTQVNARPINLFYMQGAGATGIRERLVKTDAGQFTVLNTELTFTAQELEQHIRTQPTSWSANVVLRPLYQEAILPNIAYFGGPAEVAYWLQMLPLFQHHKLPMPVVLPRIMAQLNAKGTVGRLKKAGVRYEDLLLDANQLKQLVVARAQGGPATQLEAELKLINQAFALARQKAEQADATLSAFVDAQEATVLKTLDNVEKRIQKAWEKKHETQVTQVLNLREKLLPADGLQERQENLLTYLIGTCVNEAGQYQLLEELMQHLDPLGFQFHLLEEEA